MPVQRTRRLSRFCAARSTKPCLRHVRFETFNFNTIVSGLMELLNEMATAKANGAYGSEAWQEAESIYIRMMAPITPHIAEELWEKTGHDYSVHTNCGRSR